MHLLSAPTNSEWIYFISILFGLGTFVVAAELIRKALHWSPEVTRKLVHIATGVLIYFAPEVFHSGIPAILLASVFIIVNYAAIRFGLLKGMHGTNRRSYGTVFYPLSFLILVLLFWESMPQIISITCPQRCGRRNSRRKPLCSAYLFSHQRQKIGRRLARHVRHDLYYHHGLLVNLFSPRSQS